MNSTSSQHGRVLILSVALLALAAAVTALGWLWQIQSRQGKSESARVDTAHQIEVTENRLAALQVELDAVSKRLDDALLVHRGVREEMLGLSERAGLLEDAIKRMSDRRIDNVAELHVNQAELLLTAGVERMRLFRDPDTALSAFELADAELGRLNDARFASVRQTLKREIEMLKSAPRRLEAEVFGAIDIVANALPELPTHAQADVELAQDKNDNWRSRIARMFGDLVRIRRVDPKQSALIGPLQADALRAVVGLDLLLAKEALTEGDLPRYRQSAGRASDALKQGFRLDPEQHGTVLAALERIHAYAPAQWPEVGLALEQLERVRSVAQLAKPEA